MVPGDNVEVSSRISKHKTRWRLAKVQAVDVGTKSYISVQYEDRSTETIARESGRFNTVRLLNACLICHELSFSCVPFRSGAFVRAGAFAFAFAASVLLLFLLLLVWVLLVLLL